MFIQAALKHHLVIKSESKKYITDHWKICCFLLFPDLLLNCDVKHDTLETNREENLISGDRNEVDLLFLMGLPAFLKTVCILYFRCEMAL